MGLRWIGFAADGALPQPLPPKGAPNATTKLPPWPDYKAYRYPPLSNTYSTAHVNATALLSVLRHAMRAEWREAMSDYPLPVFGLLSRGDWLASIGRPRADPAPEGARTATVETLLRLPQYHGRAVQ